MKDFQLQESALTSSCIFRGINLIYFDTKADTGEAIPFKMCSMTIIDLGKHPVRFVASAITNRISNSSVHLCHQVESYSVENDKKACVRVCVCVFHLTQGWHGG